MELKLSDSVPTGTPRLFAVDTTTEVDTIHLDTLLDSVDAWNAWMDEQPGNLTVDLNGADLTGAILDGANLRGVNLNHAKLSGVQLNRANLQGANLNGANLESADLKDANLHGANLRCTDLLHANLIRANLTDVNLTHAVLEKANLSHANLVGADLTHTILALANLHEANLERVNLTNSNLRQVNLGYSNLYLSNLENARLYRANFRHANLARANFRRADMTRADLTHANLEDANFREANMETAIFTGAVFQETILSNTKLANATCLSEAIHLGPSTLDHRTLEQSGRLPVCFLRGCGLTDSLIDHSRSIAESTQTNSACYISYSHMDKAFAIRLHDQLQQQGIRCWLDEHRLLPGESFYEQVDQESKFWNKILLCASQSSLNKWWFTNEVDVALDEERRFSKRHNQKMKTLIPVNLDGFLFNEKCDKSMASQMTSRLSADFSGWETDDDKFQKSFEQVLSALKNDDAGRDRSSDH